MKRQVQIFCFLISGLSLIGGFADILIQYLGSEELRWQIPLILIGIGSGLPVIIFPFYEPAPDKPDEFDCNENDLSKEYKDSPGLLSNSDNRGSSSEDYDGGYDTTD
ncbi:hypothetical protein ACJJIW_08240 [Microbulbifer sp. JMSA004]|uniref:hypothetical protein n=1 Tax=Microbulbifer sp. JMSA004 TaxID=3243370 RepID=UPI00403A46E1